ncbi:agmatinase [Rhizobium sp. P38BS-XIX]|uniref:arginase family protein n=1 Tax=Rhizobium sp. P38BS-XIX TaxID=2726740 RepID=UPI00145758E4|nr:arginase family protein [Rhizobium sp. P38BS-XIX]NLS00368.1 agmatinase [Rhizobium sp. P38BS-XIX]
MTKDAGFLGFPSQLPDDAKPRIVLFGAPHGSDYPGKDGSGYVQAAAEIRAAIEQDAGLVDNWDFDLGGPLFSEQPASCVDIGDLATRPQDNAGNRALIEAKTREIVTASAVPMMIGGDDSVPIPFFAGFSDSGPIWILQIDAHIDWRDELHGERFGYSSPMRRASEMAHVAGIVQVGIRGLGSARSTELDAARQFGARIVTAREVHARGVAAAVRHIPEGARIVVTLDCDGLDPSVMPGVVSRTPGGLTYTQVIELIEGASQRGRIVGFDLIELHTPSDIGGISALTAARILVNAIGRIVRQP